MTLREKALFTSAGLWATVLLGLDGGYVAHHGVDVTALITAAFGVAPAWVFLAKDIDFSFFGSKLKITSTELANSTKRLEEIAPKGIGQAVLAEPAADAQKAPPRTPLQPEPIQGQAVGKQSPQTGEASAQFLPSSGISLLQTKTRWLDKGVQAFYSDLADNVTPETLADIDPNLALVNLRIEIERRINLIVEAAGLRPMPLTRAIKALAQREIFNSDFASSLLEYVRYGNEAAHGAWVAKNAAKVILKSQAYILGALDSVLGRIEGASDEEHSY